MRLISQEKVTNLELQNKELQQKVSQLEFELEEFKTTVIPPHAQVQFRKEDYLSIYHV